MLRHHRNLQGIVRAREALEYMRVGADSGPETLLRLAMFNAGLPEPDLQLTLWAQPNAPSADLGYRARRIAIHYDGDHHREDLQKLSDSRRDKAFQRAGWTVLTFTHEDLAEDFAGALRQIKQALVEGWADPSVASGFSSGN